MNTKLFLALLCVLTTQLTLQADWKVFEKKGKYGLEDTNTGKIVIKAKYDSIYPFLGNYARVMKKEKYGLIDKKGVEYLQCKYKEILFPIARSSYGEDFFWVSQDGTSYYLTSKNNYYTNRWRNVIFGPDKIWYGGSSDGRWMKHINDPNTAPLLANFKDNILRKIKLPKGYLLFNDNIYSPHGKKIAENVGDVDTLNIKGNRYIIANLTGNGGTVLIDLASETVWKKKEKGRDGWYYTESPDISYLLGVNGDNLYHMQTLIRDNDPILIVKELEHGLRSVWTNSKKLLPFKFCNIQLNQNAGNLNGEPLWKITLESKEPVYENDLKDFVENLNSKYHNFIIETKNSLGRSLFGSTGKEIVRNNLTNVYTKDVFLRVSIDGKEQIMDMTGTMPFINYDNVWQSDNGNLTLKDFVVSKGEKIGLYVEGIGEVVPPIYDNISRLQGHIFVYNNNLVGVYDNNGHKILDPQFKSIEAGYYYPTDKNYFAAKNSSGSMIIADNNGNIKVPAGQIDRVDFLSGDEGKWGKVYKNGKMGIINLQTFKIVVPCAYEDNIFFGDGQFPNRKIGVYRKTSGGDIVDIWTMAGKKIASRFCPSNTPYKNKHWIENQLNAQFYYD